MKGYWLEREDSRAGRRFFWAASDEEATRQLEQAAGRCPEGLWNLRLSAARGRTPRVIAQRWPDARGSR